MTDTPPREPEDDIVGQVVEKAAEKAAKQAVTVPGGPPVLSRNEFIVALAVLLVLNLANLWVAIDNRNATRNNKAQHQILCRMGGGLAPGDNKDIAELLAECLR